jgi:hypothetical protein
MFLPISDAAATLITCSVINCYIDKNCTHVVHVRNAKQTVPINTPHKTLTIIGIQVCNPCFFTFNYESIKQQQQQQQQQCHHQHRHRRRRRRRHRHQQQQEQQQQASNTNRIHSPLTPHPNK